MLGITFSLLAGCAPFQHTEAPLSTNFDTTRQKKLQAAHHWQVIANDMADTLAEALAKGTQCVAPSATCPAIHVKQTVPNSAFGKAFHSQFLSRLVNKGQSVSVQGPGDIAVTVEAQTVKFSPDRSQYLGAGKFSMLGLGLWGLHNLAEHSSYHHAPGVGAMGIAIASDIVQWNMSEFAKGPTPQIELILTTSATKDGKFLARTTNVYYIADSDASLYCWKSEGCDLSPASAPPPSPPPPAIRVVGDCGPAPCISTGQVTSGGTAK
jgi:hypothetical protein